MARKDALLRLHESLIAKRDAMRKKLAGDLKSLAPSNSTGDVCDAALDGEQQEVDSQLAALESRELNQIEKAIKAIRLGRYGTCEGCGQKIPISRLKALPFTAACVDCQRQQELTGDGGDDLSGNWENAYEYEGATADRDLTMRDLDVDF